MHVHYELEVSQVHLCERLVPQDAGIVDEHVNAPVADRRLEFLDVGFLADVDAVQDLHARGIQFSTRTSADRKHVVATVLQLSSQFEPDAAVAACYQVSRQSSLLRS